MRKLFSKCDKPLLILSIIYCVLGLIMIFSASSVSTVLRYHVSVYHFFIRQAIFVILGLLAGVIVILRLPTARYRHLAILLIIIVISALVGLFMYGQITSLHKILDFL